MPSRRSSRSSGAGRGEDFDRAAAAFRSTALTCDDPLPDDAWEVVEQVEARLRRIGPPRPHVRDGAGGDASDLPPLESVRLFA